MPSDNDLDPISALKQGHLHIHCPRLELTQNTPNAPGSYVGSGYIRQTDNGSIEFTIYVTEIINHSALLNATMHWQAGTIFSDADYYSLTANSYSGHTWSADRLPNPDVDYRQNPPRVTGKIDVLRCESKEVTQGHRIIMHFFEAIDIPCTTEIDTISQKFRGAKLDIGSANFCIRKLDSEIRVEISSEAPFAPYFHVRVVEALQYVLARSMPWRVLHLKAADDSIMELSSPRKQSANPMMGRPLIPNLPSEYLTFWRLFSKYLEYVTHENTTLSWHKCTAYLHNACEASANSRDAWTSGLCVSVEKVAGLLDYVEPSADGEQREKIQRVVARWLRRKGWNDSTVGQRANGLLGSLKHPRMKDRLDALVKSGHIDPAHIRIWGKLRNPSVHAGEGSAGSTEEWWSDIGAVTVLIYHMTFYLIGYTEWYTDYSQLNWPAARYPLSVS
jgi:hypothetical protein